MPFLPAFLDLLQRRRQRSPVLHRRDVHAGRLQHLLVVVEGEGVGADRRAVRLPVRLTGCEEVGVDGRRVDPVVVGRGQHARLGEGGDDGVVDDQHVGGVVLLGREQRLVRQIAGVEGGPLDLHAGLGAAVVQQLGPRRAFRELRVGVPDGVRAAVRRLIGGAARPGGARGDAGGDGDDGQDCGGETPSGRSVHCVFLTVFGTGVPWDRHRGVPGGELCGVVRYGVRRVKGGAGDGQGCVGVPGSGAGSAGRLPAGAVLARNEIGGASR